MKGEVKTIIERDYETLKERGKVFKKSFKGSGKILKGAGKAVLKAGEAMNNYYGVEPNNKKRKNKRLI